MPTQKTTRATEPTTLPAAMPRYLTAGEAAKYLRISRSRIYQLIEAKEIPACRVGGPGSRVLFSPSKLDEWLQLRAV